LGIWHVNTTLFIHKDFRGQFLGDLASLAWTK